VWDYVVRLEHGEVLVSTVITSFDRPTLPSRRERRAERRRLKRVDMLSGHLAELHAIRALLAEAAEVVGGGWVQGAWFAVATPSGERPVTAYEAHLTAGRQVTGACLVGAVVHAAGGPTKVRSQLVQRTLAVAWHTLREEPDRRVRWCPGPEVRTMRVLDLTRWNDAPGRTRGEVVDLLLAARQVADVERDRCRADLAQVGGAHVAPL
jgi:hypothetical protein